MFNVVTALFGMCVLNGAFVFDYSKKYSIGLPKKSANFFKLYAVGTTLFHLVIVPFPNPSSFSTADMEM